MKRAIFPSIAAFLVMVASIISGCIADHHAAKNAHAPVAHTKVSCGSDFILTHITGADTAWSLAIADAKGKNAITQVMDAADGSVYVLGYYADTLKIGHKTLYAKNEDVFLAKIHADGAVGWVTSYGGPEDDACTVIYSFAEDSCVVNVFRNAFDYSIFPSVCEESYPLMQRYTGTFEQVSFSTIDGKMLHVVCRK